MITIEMREAFPGAVPEGSVDLSGYAFWIVPHTHWDREWYQTIETFRLRMSRVFDEVLDVLEADPAMRFTLDGQAVLLEDYDEQRPANRPRLERLIAEGRIAIGPWYVLPDEFIIGAESHVRNLLAGARVCRRWGGEPMRAGYVPDTFGHIAQMPQLLRGFGLDSFIFQRGLGDETYDLGAAFTWRGPDGSELLAVALVDGYSSAPNLGRWSWRGGKQHHAPEQWPDTAARRLRELVELFHGRIETAGLRDILVCNGTDHFRIQRDLHDMVDHAAERLPGAEFHIATYEEYVDHLREHYEPRTQFEGEMLGSLEHQITRPVNSTRMYLKQLNERAESELYAAEAAASLAWMGDRLHPVEGYRYDYPQGDLELAWRELLRNHPHDSICGCSIDDVHRDMLQRFHSARQYADAIRREALSALAGVREDWHWNLANNAAAAATVVNVLPWARRDVVALRVPVALADATMLAARSLGDELLPVQVVGAGDDRRALVSVDVDGFGGVPITLEAADAGAAGGPDPARAVDMRTLDNGILRVEVAEDGTLAVTDLERGVRVDGLHEFEDCGDRGDEYNFDALPGEVPWRGPGRIESVRVSEDGPVRAELELRLVLDLPQRLSDDRTERVGRVECPVTVRVRLRAGSDRVEFHTTVDNRAEDHRLRLLLPMPEHDEVRSEGHFMVLRRPDEVQPMPHWIEQRCDTHHHGGMVAGGDLVLTARGLPEYGVVDASDGRRTAIAQTLLRCVGWLSRGDLFSRPYNAGPTIATPDAQCPGQQVFEYAVSLRGHGTDARLLRDATELRQPLLAGPPGADPSGLLALDGDGHAISALKLAEDGDGLVARVFAPASEHAAVQVRTALGEVERIRLDESEATPLADGTLELAPFQVGTVRIAGGVARG